MLLLAEDKGRRKGGRHVRREQERRKGRSFYKSRDFKSKRERELTSTMV